MFDYQFIQEMKLSAERSGTGLLLHVALTTVGYSKLS
jgi:hypothetical protein